MTVPTFKGGGSNSNCNSFIVSLSGFCVLTVLGPRIVIAWLATLIIEPRPSKEIEGVLYLH